MYAMTFGAAKRLVLLLLYVAFLVQPRIDYGCPHFEYGHKVLRSANVISSSLLPRGGIVFGIWPALRTIVGDRADNTTVDFLFEAFPDASITKSDNCGVPLHSSCVDVLSILSHIGRHSYKYWDCFFWRLP